MVVFKLFGGDGDDSLNGGAGKDKLTGGAGDDTFVFAAGSGRDFVLDFAAGGTDDELDLSQSAFQFQTLEDVLAHASETGQGHGGHGTVIDLGDGDSVKLVGVLIADLTLGDFIF